MRDIKFRAWDEENRKMIDPFQVGSELSECWPPEMQFTGLKDKHGKEIYEGDLLKYDGDKCPHCGKIMYIHPEPYKVVWDNESLSFEAVTKYNYMSPDIWSTEMEIVGNIYEDISHDPVRMTENNA